MRARSLLLVVGWVVVVLVGSSLVWAVITRTGGGLVASGGEAGPASGTSARSGDPGPGTTGRGGKDGQPSGRPSDRPSDPPSDRPTGRATDRPGGQPSAGSPSGAAGPSGSPDGPASSSPPSTSSPAADEPVRRTWSGQAGTVTAECRGSTISLEGAVPSYGWGVEPHDGGPAEIEVRFRPTDDDGGGDDSGGDDGSSGSGSGEVRVEGVCRGGAPVFAVDD